MPPARVKAAADAWPTNCPSSLQPCESFLSRPPRSPCSWVAVSTSNCRCRSPPRTSTRINETAQENRWFRVEYVEPIATKEDDARRPADGHRVRRRRRRSAFAPVPGDVETIPIELVKGVTVKERASGAAAGAGIGLGAGALFVGGLALLAPQCTGRLSRFERPASAPVR